MSFILIVAVSDNGVIGSSRGESLWHLRDDLRHFKKLTTGFPIIMGRKTYDSIGQPLPDRTTIIVTRSDRHIPGTLIAHTPAEALKQAKEINETHYLIGGAELYTALFSQVDEIWLSRVHTHSNGDVVFDPPLPSHEWRLVEREEIAADEHNDYAFTRLHYSRTPGH